MTVAASNVGSNSNLVVYTSVKKTFNCE